LLQQEESTHGKLEDACEKIAANLKQYAEILQKFPNSEYLALEDPSANLDRAVEEELIRLLE